MSNKKEIFISYFKKLKRLSIVGFSPYAEGKYYYENRHPLVEKEAKRRIEICKSCKYFKEEPIPKFQLWDDIEAEKKQCGKCGCLLPYKIRQIKDTCNKWQK